MIYKDKNKSSCVPITLPCVVPPIMETIIAKSDGGALRYYFENEDKGVLINMKPVMNQIVNIPNNVVIKYYFKGQIPVSLLLSKKCTMCTCDQIYPQCISRLFRKIM